MGSIGRFLGKGLGVDPGKESDPWIIERGNGPVVAVAIHAGHALRPEVARHMALSPSERLREEDPFTGLWTAVGDSRVVVQRSRFEVDMNRPRERAVYAAPIDCWNLQVSKGPVPEEVVANSLRLYERFYSELFSLLEKTRREWGGFVVLDLHSYNHRRAGAGRPPADPARNPDINVGTVAVDRSIYGPLIDRFIEDLRGFEVAGQPLDARENVNFRGGHLVRWVGAQFPTSCPLAIEVKKIYMDELTGTLDQGAWKEVHRALEGATAGCRELLGAG